MPQYRNDGTLTVDYSTDYLTAFTLPAAIDVGATADEMAGATITSLIGAKASEELNTITGWEVQPSSIPLEGYAGPEVGSLAGSQTYPDSSLTWLSASAVATIFDLMDPDATPTAPAIIFGRWGQTAGGFYELFPVEVASRPFAKGRNVPGTFTANFSLNVPITGTFVDGG